MKRFTTRLFVVWIAGGAVTMPLVGWYGDGRMVIASLALWGIAGVGILGLMGLYKLREDKQRGGE